IFSQRFSYPFPSNLQRLRQHPRFADYAYEIGVGYPARQDMHVDVSGYSGAGGFSDVHSKIDAVGCVEMTQNRLHALGQGHHLLGGIGGDLLQLVQVGVGDDHDVSVGVWKGIENDVAVRAAMDDAGLLVAFFGSVAEDAARLRLGAGYVGVTPRSPELIHGGRVAEGDGAGRMAFSLDPATTRSALIEVVRQAKRGKAFQECRFIGLALDGTGTGRSQQSHCVWCRPIRDAKHNVIGYHHKLVTISVVGTGLTLPFDVEPYGPGDSELAAAQRLLRRVMGSIGTRFADYLVVDGEYAGAPFLHAANRLGLRVVARLKNNLPLLVGAVQR